MVTDNKGLRNGSSKAIVILYTQGKGHQKQMFKEQGRQNCYMQLGNGH